MSLSLASRCRTTRRWRCTENLGFTEVGIFRDYAIKDGEYISSVWMQRVF